MTKVAEVNRLIYESPGVAESFIHQTTLCPAEELVLDSFKDEIKDQPLLEIGVGGGRATPYLTALTKDYIGIDCSRRMLDVARQKFPSARFLVCAAEEMSIFENQHFATAVFWGNGIDEVEHKQRVFILNEINRVLKKGGIFLLSSHNFDWGRLLKSAFDEFSVKRGPVHFITTFPRRLRTFLHCEVIRLFARKRGYAVFPVYWENPDVIIPVYHISSDAQTRQLIGVGFEHVQVFASRGVALNDPAVHVDHNGLWDYELYYAARKS